MNHILFFLKYYVKYLSVGYLLYLLVYHKIFLILDYNNYIINIKLSVLQLLILYKINIFGLLAFYSNILYLLIYNNFFKYLNL